MKKKKRREGVGRNTVPMRESTGMACLFGEPRGAITLGGRVEYIGIGNCSHGAWFSIERGGRFGGVG